MVNPNDYKEVSLSDAQQFMLEGLKEIDRICTKYNLNYWLDSGTLLGAVRHKGFIPWDDDVDICMDRKSYNTFIKIAKNDLSEDFFLQNHKTDPNSYVFSYFKIRAKNTLVLEKDSRWHKFHYDRGFPVDVFPCDIHNNSWLITIIRKISGRLYSYKTSEPITTKPSTNSIKSRISYFLYKSFSKIVNANFLDDLVENFTQRLNQNSTYLSYGIGSAFYSYTAVNKEFVFPLKKIEFEGFVFNSPNKVNEYLINLYGENYMMVPPIEKQNYDKHYTFLGVL